MRNSCSILRWSPVRSDTYALCVNRSMKRQLLHIQFVVNPSPLPPPPLLPPSSSSSSSAFLFQATICWRCMRREEREGKNKHTTDRGRNLSLSQPPVDSPINLKGRFLKKINIFTQPKRMERNTDGMNIDFFSALVLICMIYWYWFFATSNFSSSTFFEAVLFQWQITRVYETCIGHSDADARNCKLCSHREAVGQGASLTKCWEMMLRWGQLSHCKVAAGQTVDRQDRWGKVS